MDRALNTGSRNHWQAISGRFQGWIFHPFLGVITLHDLLRAQVEKAGG
jgi:hypothetical protein